MSCCTGADKIGGQMMTEMVRRKASCPLRRSTLVEMMSCIYRTKAFEVILLFCFRRFGSNPMA